MKVAVLGGIRSGKDTVTDIVEELLGGDVRRYAFSDGIHDIIREHFPQIYEQGKPRKALQEIGQLMRQFDPYVWINKLFIKISRDLLEAESEPHIIITDVRQPNEADALLKEGFIIIKVTAPKEVRMQRAKEVGDNFNKEMFNHETELLVDECRYTFEINNDTTLDALKTKVTTALISQQGE